MSYLSSPLRLHFGGRFQATVSTVNNDVRHFNNAKFKSNYQDRQAGNQMNGWWNPDGDGVWRFLGCSIASAFMTDGTSVGSGDPVLTMSIADSDDSAPAKIVDLDPEQQLASTLFGLKVRIADSAGNTLMQGDFEPSAFTELWNKVQGPQGGDGAFGALWQSVITVTNWGDVSTSPFLQALQAAAVANGNLLSIKFNVDCFSLAWPTAGAPGDNQFCRGRIVGTIGPATLEEPHHFVLGRQLLVLNPSLSQSASVNYCAAVVDSANAVIRLDLGNSLTVDGDGNPVDNGDLSLVVSPAGASAPTVIWQIDYQSADWYATTAGIVEVPIPPSLASVIANNPLGLTYANLGSSVLLGEVPPSSASGQNYPGGLYVRADLFVYRLSPGEAAQVNFFATVYGQPYAGQGIVVQADNSGLQGGPGDPPVGTPASGLSYASAMTTDANGKAVLTLTGGDPQNARGYIDGQIYGVGYALANQSPTYPSNAWNFVSVLIFDEFTSDSPPTWYGSMQPIFQQYANLYPVMKRFVDLGSYPQVAGYASMLQRAFGLPIKDPNCMPVTRDLSPAKRAAILQWLQNPLEGAAPAQKLAAVGEDLPVSPEFAQMASKGGKMAAMSRRIRLSQ
ncbi:hypothetical protein BH11VER1_BH11VER1_35000 [soil metagenome]